MLYSDAGKGKSPGEVAQIQRGSQPFCAGLTPNNLDLNFRCSLRSVQGNHGASLTDGEDQKRLLAAYGHRDGNFVLIMMAIGDVLSSES
jgi:hypothetical protein